MYIKMGTKRAKVVVKQETEESDEAIVYEENEYGDEFEICEGSEGSEKKDVKY